MTLELRLVHEPDIPIEAEVLNPSILAGKDLEEIASLPVWQGNRCLHLDDFFEIDGAAGRTAADTTVRIEGNLRDVKMIGANMDGGKIEVHGDVGMYLAARMRAGRVHVFGSVASWAAAEMEGGNIQIEGDAGDYLCAALRGSMQGMRGGRVYVTGSVGNMMAANMRRGFIVVGGDVGEMAAAGMQGGTIIVGGSVGTGVGTHATRGLLIILGKARSLMPTYLYSGTAPNEFIPYYLRYVESRHPGLLPHVGYKQMWIKYQGDFAEDTPRMEIYTRAETDYAETQSQWLVLQYDLVEPVEPW